ncbi:MAG: hypothetical protein VX444_04860 [Pseudomonadota bacterium]|nr:hypothetical protein [Pseudomonadota bacterium]
MCETGRVLALTASLICVVTPALSQVAPADEPSFFEHAESALETARFGAASKLGQRAFSDAQTDSERLRAARLVSAAYFAMGRYFIAQYWLRRATNFAQTPDDAFQLRDDMSAIRKANPINISLSFSVAPSDNVNGGAADRTFTLGDFILEFAPSSLALSGIEYSSQVDILYNLGESATGVTAAGLSFYGRTYSLSRSAKESAPDVSGSDYAFTQIEASLRHRQSIFDGLGPTEIGFQLGKTWYGGEALRTYQRIALSQDFILGQNAAVTISGFAENQVASSDAQVDTRVYDLKGIYAQRLPNQDVLRLTLQRRFHDADAVTFTYSDSRFVVNYELAQRYWDTKLSFFFGYGYKDYAEYSLSLDGRRDRSVSAGVSAVFEGVSYFGFSPNVTLAANQTRSNVARFTSNGVEARLGFTSNF